MGFKLKVSSLFSGCGGMDLGMLGGFSYLGKEYPPHPTEIVYASDFDRYACEIYDANFPHHCHLADIREVESKEIPAHHILTGGFPCQSFSVVAQNPPRLGYKDEKGKLFFEMVRILEERRPLCFIAENVKGLISANGGRAFPLVLKEFENAGYHVSYKVLDASDFGIPQKRERVFIVGFADQKAADCFSFPKGISEANKTPLSSVLDSDDSIPEKYFFSEKAINGMKRVREKMNKGRVQPRDQPCNTIGAHLAKVSLNSTDPVLETNEGFRRFTPREAARIQSFPETFTLVCSEGRQYRAIGNAVPPVLMWHVTSAVVKALMDSYPKIASLRPYRTPQEKRSFNMSRIRSKDTSIELMLRKAFADVDLVFETNNKELPGTPDITLSKHKIAVFCDSSFWHGRNIDDTIARVKTNKDYWEKKISRNVERDSEIDTTLQNEGWTVFRFWDEQIINDPRGIVNSVLEFIVSSGKKDT